MKRSRILLLLVAVISLAAAFLQTVTLFMPVLHLVLPAMHWVNGLIGIPLVARNLIVFGILAAPRNLPQVQLLVVLLVPFVGLASLAVLASSWKYGR